MRVSVRPRLLVNTAQAAIDAAVLDGRRLEAVEAVGKNLVLRFDGGVAMNMIMNPTAIADDVTKGTPQ